MQETRFLILDVLLCFPFPFILCLYQFTTEVNEVLLTINHALGA